MTDSAAVRLVKSVLREAGLPEAEGGTAPGIPVTVPGWHVSRSPDGHGARVTYWGTQVLTGAEKRTALDGYAPVLRAAGLTVGKAERGGFLPVTAW